jgi:hypothetical protein
VKIAEFNLGRILREKHAKTVHFKRKFVLTVNVYEKDQK